MVVAAPTASALACSPADVMRRLAEFVALYVGLPLLLAFAVPIAALLPTLWVAGAIAWCVLRRGVGFDRGRLTSWEGWRNACRPMVLRVAVAAVALVAALWWHRRELLFRLPLQHPGLWVAALLIYPLLSVYPQALVYRALYRHRYAPVFAVTGLDRVAGTLVFALAHLPFGNGWSVGLTLVGGYLFLRTYDRTGSLPLSCLEHALYGNLLFTVGWGWYFYCGGTRALLAGG